MVFSIRIGKRKEDKAVVVDPLKDAPEHLGEVVRPLPVERPRRMSWRRLRRQIDEAAEESYRTGTREKLHPRRP